MTRYLAIALVVAVAGAAQAAERKLDRTFTVAPGGILNVDADGGGVRVSGSDGDKVVVHMISRGSQEEIDKIEMDAAQNGNDVSVTMKQHKRNWFNWGGGEREDKIEVIVPTRYRVDVHTSGGGVELRDTTGNASLRSSG